MELYCLELKGKTGEYFKGAGYDIVGCNDTTDNINWAAFWLDHDCANYANIHLDYRFNVISKNIIKE